MLHYTCIQCAVLLDLHKVRLESYIALPRSLFSSVMAAVVWLILAWLGLPVCGFSGKRAIFNPIQR